MNLTPDMLVQAYDYLLSTPPFKRWKLPPSFEVEFHVKYFKDRRGQCLKLPGPRWAISINPEFVGHTVNLMRVMAHELIHIRCDQLGIKSHHGEQFHRYAAQVCRHHGFDPKEF
jgi:hypothetical protein